MVYLDSCKKRAPKHTWFKRNGELGIGTWKLCSATLSWWLEGWLSWICRAVSNPSRTCLGTTMHSLERVKGSSRLTTNKPSLAIVATFRYRLTSLTLVSFFDGLVPWTRWACVRLRSLHSDWMANQDARVVKGNLAWPWRMSWIEVWRTTDSWVRWIKAQTWQVASWQGEWGGGALRLAKSDGRIAALDTCLTKAWKRLTTERKVETCGLAENSPRHSFSNAWTHGLLSVRMHAL